ncbi:MAG TPA: LysR family transcriptional regulator, partial [Casimicrobiaceae bacterium]|nr:LysR family transcriptional regulator [Casimicrobiaceae bacterium]
MRIDLDALAVLDAIDRAGSFAAAARLLDRVPSAITYTVRKLEDDLDVLLFDRRGRHAKPTAAARELLTQGRVLLAEAAALEQRVQRVASGWEAELAIAVDTILPMGRVWPLAARFYVECRERQAAHTRLRFSHEVLGGAWDALAEGRVDLVVGASGEAPPGGGFRTRLLAETPMVFLVAPSHPLARTQEPIAEAALLVHRGVVAADSSRRLPPRSVGLLTGQETLTVASLADKRAAQVAGLGCGWLPWFLAADDVAAGRLVPRTVDVQRPPARIVAAWRDTRPGKALQWWIEAVGHADWRFLASGPVPAARVARPPRRSRRATT